jgi:hypothetical protein
MIDDRVREYHVYDSSEDCYGTKVVRIFYDGALSIVGNENELMFSTEQFTELHKEYAKILKEIK